MNKDKIETAKGLCVVDLTKYLMNLYSTSQDEAYKRLVKMELYSLLIDDETRLYLESDSYLKQCCKTEIESGVDALYEFIKPDI